MLSDQTIVGQPSIDVCFAPRAAKWQTPRVGAEILAQPARTLRQGGLLVSAAIGLVVVWCAANQRPDAQWGKL